jgi:hypothetical protein
MATGAELRERYGRPPRVDSGDALRRLGLRDSIHPHDAFAFLYPSQEAADAFAAANLEHYGHPDLGSYATDEGVIGVTDLRHALPKVTDPTLADDLSVKPGKHVPSSAGGGPRDFSAEVHGNFTQGGPVPSPQTVAVDFDGVIHAYSKGWRDGTIYDGPVEGALDALRTLMGRYAVVVHTARDPAPVVKWLTGFGFNAEYFPGEQPRFWSCQTSILVTNRKPLAVAYIDDRAIRFTGWDQALADLAAVTVKPEPGSTGSQP